MQRTLILLSLLAVGALSFTLAVKDYTVNVDNATVTYEFPAEKVTGSISGLSAEISFDPANLSGSMIKGSVDVSTLDTGIKGRNNHLQAKSYFHADDHPKLMFESTAITQKGDGFEMTGNLTMKGHTEPVTWNFTFDDNVFNGTTTLTTSSFGVFGKKPEKSEVHVTVSIPVN